MNARAPSKKKSALFGWIVLGLVIFVFVGARQLHPGGIRGLLTDFNTEASSSDEVRAFHTKMLNALRPMGAGALCLQEYDDAELRGALEDYNNRNQAAMRNLINSIEAAGGLSKSEKDLLDRQALREAHSFLGQGSDIERTCKGLAVRFNSGEFDLQQSK